MESTLKIITLVLVVLGAGIMMFGIVQYCKVQRYMKSKTYDEKTFKHWIFRMVFILMVLVLSGYVAFFVLLLLEAIFKIVYFITGLLLLTASVFTVLTVSIQRKMADIISHKTSETIQLMIDVMETKDFFLKGHSEHVRNLVDLIYEALPSNVKKTVNIYMLRDAAILHDIGKTSTLDSILSKPGMLAADERSLLRQHTDNGKAILEKTAYKNISDWVYYHHERMDGKGYYNLPGSQIPLESKILAVADTFSALYSDRPYRKKFPLEKSIAIVKEVAGTQLDPYIVKIFTGIDPKKIDQASVS